MCLGVDIFVVYNSKEVHQVLSFPLYAVGYS